MRFHLAALVIIPYALATAQLVDSTVHLQYGYIVINVDSMGTPLFIDGVFVGESPLENPIPILPGLHEVSYLPPEIDSSYLKKRLSEAIKQIYVYPNDTLIVRLYYDYNSQQFQAIKKENTITNYLGLSLIIMVFFLLWNLTG